MRKVLLLLIMLITPLCFHKEYPDYQSSTKAEIIAKISLVSYDGVSESKYFLKSLGHSFIAIENISDCDLILSDHYILKPNEMVTLSWWAISSHFGIWYNVEPHYILKHQKYDMRVSITKNVDKSDFQKINEYLKNNDNYSPLSNCAKHSLTLFNLVSGDEIPMRLIVTPMYIVKEIKRKKGYETNFPLNGGNDLGFYDKDRYVSYDMV